MDKRRVLVVLQARLGSTRLPAKALLPIGGIPSVVLSARRAANTGLPVVVATSIEQADDPIADAVSRFDLPVVRGPLDDVLARFVDALRGLTDDAIVVRLTADNMFPDGHFVQALVNEFAISRLDYLGTASPQDGLPYGLSAEAFSAGAVRRAAQEAKLPTDREHVTPWMRRHLSTGRFTVTGTGVHWPRLRCTLDTYDDYLALLRVFAGVDPVSTPWADLVSRLAERTVNGYEPRCPYRDRGDGKIRSVLTLGTVQWGVRYGISNQTGMPSDRDLAALLVEASDAGVTALDTARAYGSSEERIGRLLPATRRERFEIITKLDVLQDLSPVAAASDVRRAVEASVFRSAHALRIASIDVLLLHRWSHRRSWEGAAWSTLLELRAAGVVTRLGASVSSPAEALEALQDPDVAHLQCPVNLLDARWRAEAVLDAVRARPDVVIHARSAFLQGLLTLPAIQWPPLPDVDASRLCNALDTLVHDLGRRDRVDLCLAYVRGLAWVDSIVVGVETRAQLSANLAAIRLAPLDAKERRLVADRIPALPTALLDPSTWAAHRV
jgi:spore coat polysaccharide biosynthesis protein SpsF (cytidylyltransferase family)/aryl-alcohol dehydrogenase-like predicted oxidoreductase